MSKPTILFISPSEYCHNPRILKASDSFSKAGFSIIVWEIVQGSAEPGLNEKIRSSRPHTFISFDISKNNIKSIISWFLVSIIQKLAFELWRKFQVNTFLFKYARLKGLLGFKCPIKFNYIYTNVVDALPFASYLARLNNKKIIFDSQEYFKGQFENEEISIRKWVEYAEKDGLPGVHLVIGTTDCLLNQLKKDYPIDIPFIRVRNLPFNQPDNFAYLPAVQNKRLELIWHGYAIHLQSRGINIILEAVTLCDFDIHITLMGKLGQEERIKIAEFMKQKNCSERITFLPPAHPEQIVESLLRYDIGVIGELPLNQNQRLTSSNKLFEYLHAGLAVVTSNMPGIIETIDVEGCGLVYEAGNAQDLAAKLNQLYNDNPLLESFKNKARIFAANNNWQKDFERVIELM